MNPADFTRLKASLEGRYRIERELGEGGMATVYLADDLRHERRVALKVLRPELAAIVGAGRFLAEIKTTANLQHPHILPLFDSGEADSFLFYVMPYVEGESLRERLDRETQLPVDESVRIATDVAEALQSAHEQGVIHRDVKPANILLSRGRPLVADFGIALAVSAAGGGRLTGTGLSLGTPHYMSPEQTAADRSLDGRSDVYSLGVVLYEMLVGEPPFTGKSAQAIVARILTDDAVPASRHRPSVPPHIDAVISTSLSKLPADRFKSAAAFRSALVNPAFGAPHGGVPGQTDGRRGAVWKRPGAWLMAAGGGAIALAGTLLLSERAQENPGVVRFRLDFPVGQRIDVQPELDAPFAVSPDGRQIVYASVASGDAISRLYVRPLDRIEGVPLPGTEGAYAPFFSPDGSWIGFGTGLEEQLKKVPVAGGPTVTLVAADHFPSVNSAASWADGGFIIYSTGTELRRVSVDGTATPVAVPIDLSGDERIGWPSVLPGGDAVLLTRCPSRECRRPDVVVVDVRSGTFHVVVPAAKRAWYLESGSLVYITPEGALYIVPFDRQRLRTIGSPQPVLGAVADGAVDASRISISTSGAMVYLPSSDPGGVQLVAVDRSGQERLLSPLEGFFEHPRLSPSGDRVAVTLSGEDGLRQVWIYNILSETLTQLTSRGSSQRPTWSPDGRRVAFISRGTETTGLHWMPADGSASPEAVFEGGTPVGSTFWTRDGAWIVTDGDMAATESEDIIAYGTGTDRAPRAAVATPAREEAASVSPDGRWIAYGSDESGTWQVYVRPFLAPGGRWLVSPGVAGAPLWTSDDELVYVDEETVTLTAVRLRFGESVQVVERTRLFDFSRYSYSRFALPFDVSRDGDSFLVLRRADLATGSRPVVVLHGFEYPVGIPQQ